MPPIACGRLKSVSNLERNYGLRMPVRSSRGRTRLWQLLPRLMAMRISHRRLSLSLSLSLSLVPVQIRGLVLRIGCGVWEIAVSTRRHWSPARAPLSEGAELCPPHGCPHLREGEWGGWLHVSPIDPIRCPRLNRRLSPHLKSRCCPDQPPHDLQPLLTLRLCWRNRQSSINRAGPSAPR
jgi:hypothetical protein